MADTILPFLDSIFIANIGEDQNGNTVVDIDIKASDNASGVVSVAIKLEGPTGEVWHGQLDGTKGTLRFEIGADQPAGNYHVVEAVVTDGAGNERLYEGIPLQTLIEESLIINNGEADTDAPVLESLSIRDTVLDFANGEYTLNVDYTITDDLSGIKRINITVRDSNGSNKDGIGYYIEAPQTQHDETKSIRLSEYIGNGRYTIDIAIEDFAGNQNYLNAEELTALGFSSSFQVVNAVEDSEPPNVILFELSDPVKNFNGDSKIEVTYNFEDDISGHYYGTIYLYSPSGQVLRHSFSRHDQENSFSFTVPNYFANGEYEANIWLSDSVRNSVSLNSDDLVALGFNGTVDISGNTPDTEAPVVENFAIADANFNPANGDRTVSFDVSIKDDFSGVAELQLKLISPSGKVISSDTLEGVGSTRFIIKIPRFYDSGEYNIVISGTDRAQNYFYYDHQGLQEQGFDISFTIADDPDDDVIVIEGPPVDDDHTSGDASDDDVTDDGNNDDDGNNGHGNDDDGVDDSNPGNGDEGGNGRPDDTDDDTDDDGNNGHGNDDDGVDDSNPGNGGGNGNDNGNRPGDDDDGNNGHGNDDDGVDDSNPGNSDGSNGNGNGNRPDDDNGHGNDADGVDESNPGNSTGTNRGGNGNGRKDDDSKPGKDGQVVRERGEVLEEDEAGVQINGKQLSESESKSYGIGIRSSGQLEEQYIDDLSDLDLLVPSAAYEDVFVGPLEDFMSEFDYMPYMDDLDMAV